MQDYLKQGKIISWLNNNWSYAFDTYAYFTFLSCPKKKKRQQLHVILIYHITYTFALSSYILLVFLAYTISFQWTDVPDPITLAVHP